MGPAALSRKLQKARYLTLNGKVDEALSLYALLVREFPRCAGEYGRAATVSGDLDLADRIWTRFHDQEAKNAKVIFFLAGEYSAAGMSTKAGVLLTEAAQLDPGNFDLQYQLARFLARSNSVGQARPAVERCRNLAPRNEQVLFLSAHLDRRDDKFAEAEAQLRALIASGPTTSDVRYGCQVELAYILDRTGRFDEAMAQLDEAKKYLRQSSGATSGNQAFVEQSEKEARHAIVLPKNILETWGKSFPVEARSAMTSTLAFLSGTARSGTTLIERILDAHPAVLACDEPPVFEKMRSRIDVSASVIPAQRLNESRQLHIKNLTTALGASVAGKTILDKNPSRVIWLPQLLRAFPEMRVLNALRDPRDVVVSLYFQYHPVSNHLTLEELARRCAVLMDVWLAIREWEGLNWMETRYEDVVANLEGEGRRVTRFLGLEWHEHQARFHEHNREKPIMSHNNAADVSRPVYKRSIGRWRAYEKQLAPLLPVLEPYCRKFGYE